jgi:MFS family permease
MCSLLHVFTSSTRIPNAATSYSFSAPALNVASLLVGFLVDHHGPRRIALLCCGLCIVGCLLFGTSDSVTFNAFLPVRQCTANNIHACQ